MSNKTKTDYNLDKVRLLKRIVKDINRRAIIAHYSQETLLKEQASNILQSKEFLSLPRYLRSEVLGYLDAFNDQIYNHLSFGFRLLDDTTNTIYLKSSKIPRSGYFRDNVVSSHYWTDTINTNNPRTFNYERNLSQ